MDEPARVPATTRFIKLLISDRVNGTGADFIISSSDPTLIDQVLGFTCDVDAGMHAHDISYFRNIVDPEAPDVEPAPTPLWQNDGPCTLLATGRNIKNWINQHNLGVSYGQEVLATRVIEVFCKMGFELKTATAAGGGTTGAFLYTREYILFG